MSIDNTSGTYFYRPQAPQGWQCPVCGAVNAPQVSQCPGYHYPTYPTYQPSPFWSPYIPPTEIICEFTGIGLENSK